MPRFVQHFRSTVMVRLQLPTPPPSTLQERASDRALACTLPRAFARNSSCLQPFLVLVGNIQPAMLQGAEQEVSLSLSKPQPVPVCKRSDYLVW